MAKKTYKEWEIKIDHVVVQRNVGGTVRFMPLGKDIVLSAAGARRLFQKLSGDYRD